MAHFQSSRLPWFLTIPSLPPTRIFLTVYSQSLHSYLIYCTIFYPYALPTSGLLLHCLGPSLYHPHDPFWNCIPNLYFNFPYFILSCILKYTPPTNGMLLISWPLHVRYTKEKYLKLRTLCDREHAANVFKGLGYFTQYSFYQFFPLGPNFILLFYYFYS